jgi:hypothetical protein
MGGVGKIQSAVVHYKRGRAERRARAEVDQALAAFCAVQECPTLRPDVSATGVSACVWVDPLHSEVRTATIANAATCRS